MSNLPTTRKPHSQLHPVFAAALAPFAPAANDPAPLKPYRVQVKHGATVIRQFDAMATSSFAVRDQHEDLLEAGQKLDIELIGPSGFTESELRRADAQNSQDKAARCNHASDRIALDLQINDPLVR